MSVSKDSKPFNYVESPDGEDIIPKLGVIAKPVALTAFGVSTADVLLYSHPKGYLQTVGRYIHISWPIIGVATAFVLGHNVAGSLRKKDDKLNWFIGGASSGAVFGIWRKSVIGGIVAGLGLGILGVAKKWAIQNNSFLLFPDEIHPEFGGIMLNREDWTLMKHRPGNWTTGR